MRRICAAARLGLLELPQKGRGHDPIPITRKAACVGELLKRRSFAGFHVSELLVSRILSRAIKRTQAHVYV